VTKSRQMREKAEERVACTKKGKAVDSDMPWENLPAAQGTTPRRKKRESARDRQKRGKNGLGKRA